MERCCSFRSIAICLVIVVSLVLFIAGGKNAIAAVSWKSAVSGNWSDGTKWDTGVPPSSGDDAVITVDGTYTVTLDGNITVNSLTLGGSAETQTLSGNGKTVTLNSSCVVNSHGALNLTGGSTGGPGTLTNQGSMTLRSSTISAGFTFTNQGSLTIIGTTYINGAFAQSGTMSLDGNAVNNNVYLGVQDGFSNTGTIQLSSSAGYTATLMLTNGTLTNAAGGTIEAAGTGTGLLDLRAQLNNQGTLTVNKALTMDKGSLVHTNSGTINVNENLTITQEGTSPSFTNTGTINVPAGKTLSISGGTYNHGGALTGNGTLALGYLTMNLNAGLSNADLGLTLSYVVVNGPETLTNAVGKTLSLFADTINAKMVNQGTLVAVQGSDINGTLTQQGTIRVEAIGGTTLRVANGFTNNGTIELAGTMGVIAGTLVNPPGGTIINLNAGDWLGAQVDNQGTITVSQPMTISGALTNSGTINANSDLTVGGGFTNSGTITLAGGTTLLAYWGITNTSAGVLVLQGAGTINAVSQTVSNAGTINFGTSPGLLSVSSGYFVQTATGAMNIKIGGLTRGTEYDSIAVTYPVTFGGTLNVSLIGGFSPNVGDSFTIATYASRTGTFGTTNFPPLTGGKAWCLAYNATSAVLTVVIPPGINVKQEGTTIPDNTGSYDFGSATVGMGKAVTFTIENPGSVPLNLTGTPKVQLSGPNQADFAVTTQPTTPVSAGGSATFVITFTPGAAGARTASVSIANDNCDKNPYDFALAGAGVSQPDINVKQGGTNIPDGTGSYGFGSVNVGSNKVVTFTIENVGAGPLNLTGSPKVQISGANGSDFSVTAEPTTPVAAGNTTTFTITFTPGATGTRTATVMIANNDPDENPYDFTITGTGVGVPEINVKAGTTNIPDNTGTYDFGSVNLSSNKAVTFTIENLGTGPLNLTGTPKVQVSGTNANDFAVTTQPASPITDGTSNTFVITFTPGGAGARSATVTIPNDDSDENPYNFTINGTGTGQPEINVKQDGTNIPDGTGTYDFGTANLGSSKAITFTIENLGTAPLNLTGTPCVQVTGAQGSDFEVTTQPTSPITNGTSNTFVITFTPQGAGLRSATVTIANDDSDENPYSFTITGTGGGAPVADAGPDQNVATGVEVNLDGSDSYDSDGQPLTYLWSLESKPSGSALTETDIEGKTTPNPSFTPDVDGVYRFRLVVNDGYTDSAPDSVEIHAFPATGNIAPNARAGKDQHAKVNTLVVLDGSASYDPDDGPADMLTFLWSFKEVPPGSALLDKDLLDRDQVSASFVPDVAGTYTVELQVYDGLDTDTDEVTIEAYSANVPPNARAGQDRKVGPGEEVILDGTMSVDPDELPEPLTYEWRFVFLPPGSALTNGNIVNATTATPKFTPDVVGTYVVELTVSDGLDTDFDHVMVIATTEPWVEVTPNEGTLGTEFTLTGHHYEFGFSKGKLYMGKKTLKAVSWASESIFIRVKKANPPAKYDIKVLPKKPKGGTQQIIWERGCFTVKVPEVNRMTFISAAEGYRVTGKFFGTKKGKIYLGELACKTKTWSMNPATNESEATFLLPKGVTSGTFMLNVVNKVGRGKKGITIP